MIYNDKIRDRYINFLVDLKKVEGLKVPIIPIARQNSLNIEIPALIKTNLVSLKKESNSRSYHILKCNYKIPVEPIDAKILYEATKEYRKQFYKSNKLQPATTSKKELIATKVDGNSSRLLDEINRLKKENKKLQEQVQTKKRIRFQFPIKFQSILK